MQAFNIEDICYASITQAQPKEESELCSKAGTNSFKNSLQLCGYLCDTRRRDVLSHQILYRLRHAITAYRGQAKKPSNLAPVSAAGE